MSPRHGPQKSKATRRRTSNSMSPIHPMSLRSRTRARIPASTATSDLIDATPTTTSDLSGSSITPVILAQQTKRLEILKKEVASLEETRQSLENELKEEMLLQEAEYQCPLCLDLAWYPYVTACGHCFCSRCLSRYKAEHDRKRLEDPFGTNVIIGCPTCRASIFRKPQRSLIIQRGIEQVAVDLQVVAPPRHLLEWHY
ncbi:uncharacterized protein C8R40DRAFT_1173190 [Lentinula edodes]|uniref:uncharacterized protein n=1 Tax=Lentinula edodes TaxID=5353 RepID=UPI001E8DE0A2|nr:uncharacterized protein C8R40DRAFT_1173190 [Lentinula edodes]KAH7872792.1 hypothetical protein C8R40DRAFT_1173190 [Lentinula edodes]